MGYADNVRSASRPICWGQAHNYDPREEECASCNYRHSCGNEVSNRRGERTRTYSGTHTRTQYRHRERTDENVDAGVHTPATVEPNEKPVERFAKDAVGGGLRGMFYEMWQFWRHYRIR